MAGRASASGTGGVRRAPAAALPALSEVLARAFAGYAWTRWVVDPDDHLERLRQLYAIHLRAAHRFGQVWTTHDHSGVAAWTWSDDDHARDLHLHECGDDARVVALLGGRLDAAMRADAILAPHLLAEPHWRLQAVGVDPARRRQGVGTRLLAPVLDHCDRHGLVAALETSAPENLDFYAGLGFELRTTVEVPAGPHVWLLARRPGVGQCPQVRGASGRGDPGEPSAGLEPATPSLPWKCSTN